MIKYAHEKLVLVQNNFTNIIICRFQCYKAKVSIFLDLLLHF